MFLVFYALMGCAEFPISDFRFSIPSASRCASHFLGLVYSANTSLSIWHFEAVLLGH